MEKKRGTDTYLNTIIITSNHNSNQYLEAVMFTLFNHISNKYLSSLFVFAFSKGDQGLLSINCTTLLMCFNKK